MKVRNMPERVTRRRAAAYARAGGIPVGVPGTPTDVRFRLGRNKRLKVALKFQGK